MTADFSVFADLIRRHQWPRAIAVTGALGSGKTEWVLNLALGFSSAQEQVTIADVDIINPYFCIRQVVNELEARGFKVLTAPGHTKWGDMPLVTAEVDWALSEPNRRLLLDIGGDAEGALALKQYETRLKQAGYLLILVVNAFRPQTSDIQGIDGMRRRMEEICGLKVGAVVSNSHLMKETTAEVIVQGYRSVKAAAEFMGVPLLYASCPPELYDEIRQLMAQEETPLWPLCRYMLLPWEPGAFWATGGPQQEA